MFEAAGRWLALLAVSWVLATTGCRTPAAAPLRVGIPVWVPAEFAQVAGDAGWFTPAEVELVRYESPIELERHFRDGSLDAAAITVDFLAHWPTALPESSVLMVVDVSHGADGIVARPPATTMKELRGRRVGLEANPLGAHVLLSALQAEGMTLADVETVSVDMDDQVEAFIAGKVDAMVTYEPTLSLLRDQGAGLVFDSSSIPGDIVDVLFTRPGTVEAHRDRLRRLVAGWIAAFDLLATDRQRVLESLAASLSLNVPDVEKALAGVRLGDLATNRELLEGPDPAIRRAFARCRGLAVAEGLLTASAGEAISIDTSLLPGTPERR